MKKILKCFLCLLVALSLVNITPNAITNVEARDSTSDTIKATIDVTYNQTEARTVLDMVNEFRTSDDTWYWNEDNTAKITLTDLSELTYDYDLEKVAMQRAAEIAVYYSHTRPNGSTSWTAYSDNSYTYYAACENIAAGYTSAAAVFNGWLEEDKNYSDQGHRRNMLSSSCNAIAIACVKYNGYYYWVMELAGSSKINTTATTANDSLTSVSVNIDSSYISSSSISVDTTEYSMCEGMTQTLVNPTVSLSLTNTWPTSKQCSVDVDNDQYVWSSSDTSVATVDSEGVVTAVGKGTATITAVLTSDSSVEYTVTVSEHQYVLTNETEATCAQKGIKTYECSICGDTYTEDIAALGHTIVTDEAVEATCTETGLTKGSHCSVCGEIIVAQETIAALGHSLTHIEAKGATCENAGHIEFWYCERCNKYFSDEEGINEIDEEDTIIPALGHTVVIDEAVAATCTESGLTEGSHCSVCGEIIVYQDTIEALGHDYGEGVITKEATCEETGIITYTCSRCGDTYTEEIAALGHTIVTDEAVEATCTEDGLTEGSHCSTCGKVIVAQETIPATGHTIVTDEAVEATCTEDGLTEGSHCSVCGEVIEAQETIEALGHDHDEGVITKEATCEESGIITYTCSRCGDTYTEEIPALGHTIVIDEAVAATCTESGLTEGSHCSVCGEIIVAQETIAALGHDYGEGVIIKEATCEETGIVTYTCSRCGDTYTEEISATGHTIVIDEAVEATCTEDGLTEGSHCSVCGETIVAQETVEALGHSLTHIEAKGATCENAGNTECWYCSRCNKYFSDEEGTIEISVEDTIIPTLSHTVVIDEAVAATCTESGLTEGSHCSVCGEIIVAQETIPALGHDHDEGVITKEATCEETGVITYTCSRCGDTYTEEIAATGHTIVIDEAVAATCTENGLTEGSHCSVCGKVIVAQETIEALGHNYDEGVITKEATCEETGIITYTCSRCGDTYTEEIASTGHSYDITWTWADDYSTAILTLKCENCGDVQTSDATVTSQTTEATCTEAGKTVYTAVITTSNGMTYVNIQNVTIPATGHNYVGVVTKEATETEDGIKTYTCTECGETYTEEIAATGHTIVIDEAVAATCTENGLTEGSHCSVCGEIIVAQETIPALGHDYDEGVITKEATCEETGIITYTCSRCGDTYTEEIASTGHSYDITWTWADDYSTAILTLKCENCGDVQTSDATVTSQTTAATCTEAGKTVYTAVITTSNGMTYVNIQNVTIPATGHNYVGVVTKEATETEDGIKTYTCTECGETYTETIPALGTDDSQSSDVTTNTTESTNESENTNAETNNVQTSDNTQIELYVIIALLATCVFVLSKKKRKTE